MIGREASVAHKFSEANNMIFRWVAFVPVFASILMCGHAAATNDDNFTINRSPNNAVTILVKSSVNGSGSVRGGCQIDLASLSPPNLHCSTVLETEATKPAAAGLLPGGTPNELAKIEPMPISFNPISVQVIGVESSDVNGGSVRIIIMPNF